MLIGDERWDLAAVMRYPSRDALAKPRARPGVRGDDAAPSRGPRGRNPARLRMILARRSTTGSRGSTHRRSHRPAERRRLRDARGKGPDGQPRPLLAQDWLVSDDGLEVTFRLRPDARFHSGEPCDARAVLAALDHLRFETFPDRQLWYWDPVDTVEPVDSQTLVFRLRYPYARLPSLLWGTHSAVYDERRRASDPAGSGQEFANGTGPFRLVVVVARARGRRARPGDRRAVLDRIEWISILDESEPSGRARAGRRGRPARSAARARSRPRERVDSSSTSSRRRRTCTSRSTGGGAISASTTSCTSRRSRSPSTARRSCEMRLRGMARLPGAGAARRRALRRVRRQRPAGHDPARAPELLSRARGPDRLRVRRPGRSRFPAGREPRSRTARRDRNRTRAALRRTVRAASTRRWPSDRRRRSRSGCGRTRSTR